MLILCSDQGGKNKQSGSAWLGSTPLGSAPLGSAPLGSAPLTTAHHGAPRRTMAPKSVTDEQRSSEA